jgi:hypothetical protein
MIINQIPTRIKIQVVDEESESGVKEIETLVICAMPMLISSGTEGSIEAFIFVSKDKDGNVYGRPLDQVKITETRKYEGSQIRSPWSSPKKNRGQAGKSNNVRDNHSIDEKGDKDKGNSSSYGERDTQ